MKIFVDPLLILTGKGGKKRIYSTIYSPDYYSMKGIIIFGIKDNNRRLLNFHEA